MNFNWIKLKRYPHQTALPTITEAHRGQLRMLSGDGAATTDALKWGRNSAGTNAFVELVTDTDAQTLTNKKLTGAMMQTALRTRGTAPTAVANPATFGNTTAAGGFGTNSNAISGTVSFTTAGAGYGAGVYCTVTIPAKADTNFDVLLTPLTADAIDLGLVRATNRTTTSFDIAGKATPVVGKTYGWVYLIVERVA